MPRVPNVSRANLRARLLAQFAFAVFCVGLATSARAAVDPLIGDTLPFSAFYPAVLFATLLGGHWSGLAAFVLGGASGWLLFISPGADFSLSTLAELVSLALFTGMATLALTLLSRQWRRYRAVRRTVLIGNVETGAVRFSRPANDPSRSSGL